MTHFLRANFLVTILVGVALGGSALADPLGVKWMRRADVPGVGEQINPAARALADGRFMVVLQDNGHPVALTYDGAGVLHSRRFLSGVERLTGASRSIAIGPFGEVYTSTSGPLDRITKSDGTSGAVIWSQALPDGISSRSLTVGDDGGVVMVAFAYPQEQVVVLRWDADGVLVWGPVVSTLGDAFSSTRGRNGDIAALSHGPATVVSKISGATGQPLWTREVVLGPHCPQIGAIELDAAGNVIVTGCLFESKSAVTYKLEGNSGSILWASYFRVGGSTRPTALSLTPAGDVLMGSSAADGSSLLWKIDGRSGQILWTKSFSSNGGQTAGMTIDGAGDVYVTSSEGAGPGDILTLKVDGDDGSTIWGPVRLGDPALFETPTNVGHHAPIFLDAEGGLVVIGFAATRPDADGSGIGLTTADSDVLFQRYDPATGAELWSQPKRYAGEALIRDGLTEVLSGTNGDLVLSVQSSQISFPRTVRWVAARFSGVDHRLLWGRAMEPDPARIFHAPALTFDTEGDLVAAGALQSPDESQKEVAVAKYDGTTGALVWGPIILGPPVNFDTIDLKIEALPGGDVLAAMPNGLFRIGSANGEIIWSSTVGWRQVRVSEDGEIYIYNFGSTLSRVEPSTGLLLWTSAAPAAPWGAVLALDGDGSPIVASSRVSDLGITKFSPSDGQTLWSRTAIFSEGTPLPGKILSAPDGSVTAFGDLVNPRGPSYGAKFSSSGQPLWSREYQSGDLWETFKFGIVREDGPILTIGGVFDGGAWKPLIRTIDPSDGESSSTQIVDLSPENWIALGAVEQGGELTLVASGDRSIRLIRLSHDFLIDARSTRGPLAARLGVSFEHQFVASGGVAPYSWSTVSTVSARTLPAGLTLDSTNGRLYGTPLEEGDFHFDVRARDGQGVMLDARVSLRVFPTRSFRLPTNGVTTCLGRTLTLSAGDHAAYRWFPTGERTPTIRVRPSWRLPFGVHVTESDGSTARGAVSVGVVQACHTIHVLEPDSGPAEGGFDLLVRGAELDRAATVRIGGTEAAIVDQQPAVLRVTAPKVAAGMLHDVSVTIGGRTALLPRAFFAEFVDVSSSHPFAPLIEAAVREGMTAGCGGGRFCIDEPVVRAQAAVLLLKAKYGATYVPPPASGSRFTDVPATAFAAGFIEKVAADGITSGCGPSLFCPGAPVLRGQAAVLILKAKYGSAWAPPPATGMFLDVDPNDPFAPWIEQLAREGITAGCGDGRFCPGQAVARGQMAVFLARAFGWD